MLDVSSDGSSDTLRQLIEGKLIEQDLEPRNTQVVVSSEDAKLYLVDDSGEESEHVSYKNFNLMYSAHEIPHKTRPLTLESHEPTDAEELRAALHKARLEIEGLHAAMTERDAALTEVRAELECVREEVDTSNNANQELRKEIRMLTQSLKSQTAKAKRFWAQKCKLLLAHEAALEEKDAIIASLQEQIVTKTNSTPLKDRGAHADLPQTQSPETSLVTNTGKSSTMEQLVR